MPLHSPSAWHVLVLAAAAANAFAQDGGGEGGGDTTTPATHVAHVVGHSLMALAHLLAFSGHSPSGTQKPLPHRVTQFFSLSSSTWARAGADSMTRTTAAASIGAGRIKKRPLQ